MSRVTPPAHSRASLWSRLSLELKLPLLMTVLLCALLAAIVWASYREIRRTTVVAAEGRLGNVAGRLADIAEGSVAARRSVMAEVAAHASVRALLAAGVREDEARATLERLRIAADSMLPVQIWSADKVPLLDRSAAEPGASVEAAEWTAATGSVPDSGGIGPLFRARDETYYWFAVPVAGAGDGAPAGWIAQLRRLGGGGGSASLEPLLGTDMALRFAGAAGDFWATLEGDAEPAPPVWPFDGLTHFTGVDGSAYIGFAAPIEGSELRLIAQVPLATVLARPHAFLRWLSLVALLLVLIGGGVAWLLSRSVTAPLAALRGASGALAAGDYEHRVRLDRADEIGSLARTFNDMADQVQHAHGALERQFDAARTLSAELVEANAQLKLAMREAEASRTEAQKASRAKSDFLATMSHEIRTPINAMIGYTDLLDMGVAGPLNERQHEHLARIKASGRHLVGLVDEVLDLAGIESGRLRLNIVETEIAQSIATAAAVLEPQAVAKRVRLEACCGPEAGFYLGDPQRVEQILVNLLSNAVKFTPAEGAVRMYCSVADAWADIMVEDTGRGISTDQVDRIFEPFFQGETGYTREHGGVGLGLSISRRLARMMGGDLSVDPAPGSGARFTLRLPSVAAAATGRHPSAVTMTE